MPVFLLECERRLVEEYSRRVRPCMEQQGDERGVALAAAGQCRPAGLWAGRAGVVVGSGGARWPAAPCPSHRTEPPSAALLGLEVAGGVGAPGSLLSGPPHPCAQSRFQPCRMPHCRRCDAYLEPCTRKSLVATVERCLVARHFAAVLERGFEAMLAQNRVEDLARLYRWEGVTAAPARGPAGGRVGSRSQAAHVAALACGASLLPLTKWYTWPSPVMGLLRMPGRHQRPCALQWPSARLCSHAASVHASTPWTRCAWRSGRTFVPVAAASCWTRRRMLRWCRCAGWGAWQ